MNILVFAGRVHHVERLHSIVLALREKHAVTYLTADNYLNLDPNTAHLIRSGHAFAHTLDHLPPDQGVAHGMTSEILREIGSLADFVDPYYLSGSVREASECLLAISNLLQQAKPNLVLGLHENNFWHRILAYACQQAGIPCVSFQEGLLRMRDETTQGKQAIAADYSTKLLCWSESARDSYIRAGVPAAKLVVTGIAHLDDFLKPYNQQQLIYNAGFDPTRKLIAFLLPQVHRYDGNWQVQFDALVNWANLNGYQLAVRFHPFENQGLSEWAQRVVGRQSGIRVVATPTLDLIRAASVIVSQHSTVALEALALSKPLVELDLENYGVLESLAEQGVATLIRSGEMNKIGQILSGELTVDQNLLNLWKAQHLGPLDGKSTQRAVAELEKLL